MAGRLLTNMREDLKFIVLRAAEMTPGFKNVIYIEDGATTIDGKPLPGHIQVKTRLQFEDHSAFWKTFDVLVSLRKENMQKQKGYKGGYL